MWVYKSLVIFCWRCNIKQRANSVNLLYVREMLRRIQKVFVPPACGVWCCKVGKVTKQTFSQSVAEACWDEREPVHMKGGLAYKGQFGEVSVTLGLLALQVSNFT